MKPMKTSWIVLVATLFVVTVPAHAQPVEEPPIVKLLNEMSEKPEQHLAIAVYYRTLAADALTEAQKHEAMRNAYRRDQRFRSGAPASRQIARHCDRLIELHRETAREYEELAKLHDAEAAAK